VVSSSISEGFSNAIAEGMACGLPAIATDVGAAREIVADTGTVVPPRDPAAFATAVRALANESPDTRAARRHRARERIVANFSLECAVENFRVLYRTIRNS
jgi:glycosyltransferase involved in cell wall biosynthesis